MENRARHAYQSMLVEELSVKVKPADFRKFWDDTPANIRDFVKLHCKKSPNEIWEEAAARLNEVKMPVIHETKLRDTLNATLAGEVYALIDVKEKASEVFKEILGLLREDKIREKNSKA